jgi:F0F1-type ATP synthase assembly protein I
MKTRPSFIASVLSGTIIFIAFVLFWLNLKYIYQDPYKLIVILTLIGIGFGIHSISHYYEEIYYDFNPMIGKWSGKDTPSLKIES